MIFTTDVAVIVALALFYFIAMLALRIIIRKLSSDEKREIYEQEFEAFKLGVMLQKLRKEKGLTQEQLAERCGTTKTYISRIENNASDIRLSTLMRIIREGLGGSLQLNVNI